jgi:hypothetical protein
VPSSLIFAALAAAWLAVLVPMIAKRRQEVVRVADSALASRVLYRRYTYRAALKHDQQEVPMTGEQIAEQELDERQYRPGRGGYDPEAAALAARERYVFRQRVVLGLLVGTLATLLLGITVASLFWGVHLTLDVALCGYLVYLRKQVRIEEEVRNRRAARMAGSRARAVPPTEEYSQDDESAYEQWYEQPQELPDTPQPVADQPVRRSPPPRPHPTAVAVDLDDEDPMFDELDPAFEPRYRRAAGE